MDSNNVFRGEGSTAVAEPPIQEESTASTVQMNNGTNIPGVSASPMTLQATLPATPAAPTTLPYSYGVPQVAETVQEQPREEPNLVVWLLVIALLLVLLAFGSWVASTITIGGIFAFGQPATIGAMHTETQSFPLNGATASSVNLNIQAGNLNITGGSGEFAVATFSYNIPQWKPTTIYDTGVNGTGHLAIDQPKTNNATLAGTRNDWDIQINNDLPTTMKASLNAGNLTMKLGGSNVTDLTIDNHAGNVKLDLSGKWARDLNAGITGEANNITITVPGNVGVRLTASTTVGNVSAPGFVTDGKVYTNDAYGKSPVTLNIEATNTVGNIVVTTVR